MICKYCAQTIPDGSLFCMYCGERLARKRREAKAAPRYPKPRTLANGTLLGQLMVEGERVTVKGTTEAEYRARIDGIRTGVLERKAHPEKRTLAQLMRAYIDANDAVLSPATIRGYEYIYKGRFTKYRDMPVEKIDFQQMVNDESKIYAPKTVENAWALVEPSLRAAKIPVPDVNLPTVPPSAEDFLDYEQIKVFLQTLENDRCELASLLMLHSLRMSELLNLTLADVEGGKIRVHGAVVRDKTGTLVEKDTTKSRPSSREIPVMIPRLAVLLDARRAEADGSLTDKLVAVPPTTLASRVKSVCKRAGLPECSPHDLRRSFASLGYHLKWSERAIMAVGGWSNLDTVHKIYVKLVQSDLAADVESMRNYYGFTTESKKSAD